MIRYPLMDQNMDNLHLCQVYPHIFMVNPVADSNGNEETWVQTFPATEWKKSLGCKYAQLCKHCVPTSIVCKDDTDALSFCSVHRSFYLFKPKMTVIEE